MSTALVHSLVDFHCAVIVDGVSITVATVKMLLCNVPVLHLLLPQLVSKLLSMQNASTLKFNPCEEIKSQSVHTKNVSFTKHAVS